MKNVYKLWIAFIVLALCAGSLQAAPVDTAMAKRLAGNFYLQKLGLSRSSDAGAIRATARIAQRAVTRSTLSDGLGGVVDCYYVINFDNGFVILAADDRVVPVLAYSTAGIFDTTNVPPAVAEWLEGYRRDIAQFLSSATEAGSNEAVRQDISGQWYNLRHNVPEPQRAAVAPLLQTTWDQNRNTYNALCPDSAGIHALTGCTATAFAQVIRYWEYPDRGIGTHSYNHSKFGTLTADFGGTHYDYDLMPNSLYTNGVLTATADQINAVATLLYHCGVSVNMDYDFSGSGASLYYIPKALTNYFGYPAGASYVTKSSYTNAEWNALLKNELNNHRPVIYSGWGSVGHAFVLDGYDNSGLFHVNWGWSGSSDGYFQMGALSPGNITLNLDNDAVIGVDAGTPMLFSPRKSAMLLSPVGGQSDIDSVDIRGIRLSDSITVTVSGDFSIGVSPSSLGTTAALPANGGILYVQYTPSVTDPQIVEGQLFLSSGMCHDTISVFGQVYQTMCLPPTNLTADVTSTDVNLSWTAPVQSIQETTILSWDSTTNRNFRYNNNMTYCMLQRFAASDITQLTQHYVESISFIPRAGVTSYRIVVYQGGTCSGNNISLGEQLVNQEVPVSTLTVDEWNNIRISNPVILDNTQDLWFGIFATVGSTSSYLFNIGSTPYVADKGGIWGCYSGEYVENADFLLRQMTYFTNYFGSDNYERNLLLKATVEKIVGNVERYDIYHNNMLVGSTTGTNYTDNHALTQPSRYTVDAVWDNSCSSEVSTFLFPTIPCLPTVTTGEVVQTSNTMVSCGGEVIHNGNLSVTTRGVCWSTSPNPTVSDDHTTDGSGVGVFTSEITGLTPGSTYYVRAYATNSEGTAYGEEVPISLYYIVPQTSTETCTISRNTVLVYDDGGPDNNYSDNGDGILILDAGSSDATFEITGTYSIENNWDFLYIYDGSGISGTQLAALTGNGAISTTIVSTQSTITFSFESDNIVSGSGFSLQVKRLGVVATPTVTTSSVGAITDSTAVCGGVVVNDGGETVSARGICWSLSPNPTVADAHTTNGAGLGAFTSAMTGLTSNTTYYVRAYVTNSVGTAYGNEMSFTTDGPFICGISTVKDYDGNRYNTVKIGDQCWMKENLRTTHNSDGTEILLGTALSSTDALRYCPNNDSNTVNQYGYLYNWKAVAPHYSSTNPSGIQGICPDGWHVPSFDEFWQLTNYLSSNSQYFCSGNSSRTAKALAATSGWVQTTGSCYVGTDVAANNASGFTAYPAGQMNGSASYFGSRAYFWTTTWYNSATTRYHFYFSNTSYSLNANYSNSDNNGNSTYGKSVRCVKDSIVSEDFGEACPGVSSVTDVDGNVYKTVRIGLQCWMKENLRTTHYADGTEIPLSSGVADAENPYRFNPNFDASRVPQFGYLYNWAAVMHGSSPSVTNPSGVQGICPNGWHVPSFNEFWQLSNYLSSNSQYFCSGNSSRTAKALAARSAWQLTTGSCNVGTDLASNNATGFTAYPAGYINGTSSSGFGTSTYFWTATEYSSSNGNSFHIINNDSQLSTNASYSSNSGSKVYGEAVRCVQAAQVYPPTVTTDTVSDIGLNSATCGGNVTDDGNLNVTARGVCWSTSPDPTIVDYHTTDGAGTGAFVSSIAGLALNTTYYVRAYATNSAGTGYGEQQIFTTLCNPVTVTITGNTTISYGGGTSLSASGANSYVWSDGADTVGTTASVLVRPTTTTTYTVTGTNSYGCTATASVTVTVNWVVPTVSTSEVHDINTTMAIGGGDIISDGGETVTARGVCWGVSPFPTVAGAHTTDGTGSGTFTSIMTGLTPNTTYYVRAYATNSVGTAYGNEMSFTTDGPFICGISVVKDYDGNRYNTVKIGDQCWMKENLRTTHNSDGTEILLGTALSSTDALRYYPNNDPNTVSQYGYLYNWKAVAPHYSSTNPSGIQGICPDGWHVPSFDEFWQLTNYLSSNSQYFCSGNSSRTAKALAATLGWVQTTSSCYVGTDVSANNASGFTAYPAGQMNGSATEFGTRAYFWTTTWYSSATTRYHFYISNTSYSLNANYSNSNNSGNTTYGKSVRCVKDSIVSEDFGEACPGVPSVTDVDGNVYKTVRIGFQCWMKENLRTTHYADGTEIPLSSGVADAENPYRFNPNFDASRVPQFGYLYNWAAVMHGSSPSATNPSGVQGICPNGWHVPSMNEFFQMVNYMSWYSQYYCNDNSSRTAKALAARSGWQLTTGSCNVGTDVASNNATGFTAYPAGYINGTSSNGFGTSTYFWTATEYSSSNGNSFHIINTDYQLSTNASYSSNSGSKVYGEAVRCVQAVVKYPPVVTTDTVSDIGATSATCGGYVTDHGNANITGQGVCWNTTPNPTVNNSHTLDGILGSASTGAFTSSMTGLTPNTTYYVRAYATNSAGTGYGEQRTFTTACPPVTVSISGLTTFCEGITSMLTASGSDGCTYVWNDGSVGSSKIVSSSGTYSVEATNQYGCTATATATVTVNPTPDITINGNTEICQGESSALVASGALSYIWASAGTPISTAASVNVMPTATTIYNVTGTGNYGCYATAAVTVTVTPLPEITITGSTTIPYGSTTTLTAWGADSYVWKTGNTTVGNTATITVSPTSTTTYTVTGTNQYGCTGTASVTVIMNAILPTVTTSNVSSIAATTATSGGNVTSDGGAAITARGICWSTSQNPTVSDSHTINSTGTGGFTSIMTGLTPNTTYYVRAYATNSAGTTYGEQQIFTTSCNTVTVSVTGTTTISYGGSTNLTASGANNYVWKNGNTTVGNTASITVNPTATTTYSVMGTNQYGCTGTASVTVTVNAILPTVTTKNVSNIATTTATSGGNITSDGGSAITARGICWSTSQSPTVNNSHTDNGSGTGVFTSAMTDLTPNTTYYVRSYATNSAGTAYGEQKTFTTLCNTVNITVTGTTTINFGEITTLTASGANNYVWKNGTTTVGNTASVTVSPTATTTYSVTGTDLYGCIGTTSVTVVVNTLLPTVTTNMVSNIAATMATSGGNVTSDGGSGVTARGVCWSTSQNPTVSDSHTINGTGTGGFTSVMTGLTPNTTYYVRAFATNSAGTVYGEQQTFTTSCNTVTVSVTGTTTISYGGSTNLTASGANNYVWKNGNTTVGNTASITVNPTATTTYSVTGTNQYGCTGTANVTVTVNAILPTVTTNNVSNIAASTTTSGGNVTSDGGAAVTARGVCWSTSQNPTVNDSHTTNGTGTGSFTSSMTGLTPNTIYYVRAFATNSAGTAYGEQMSFTTGCNTVNVMITGTTTIPYGSSTTLTASGAISYVWVSGNTTVDTNADITVAPMATTTYSVTGTNQYGCTGTSSVTVNINAIYPTVTTSNISNISVTNATSGGNVTSDGGATVIARGICWSTSSSPTVSSDHTSDGVGTGSFTSALTNLMPNTTYYVRAYATNAVGTSYGQQRTFTTGCNTVTVGISGETTFCQGYSTALTAAGDGSYLWSTGDTGNVVVVTTGGLYTVTATNQYGCTGTASTMVTVNTPVNNATSMTVCESYTWTSGNGQTYTTSGDYTYAHLDANGCTQVDTLHLIVSHGTHNVETETACESYTWHGQAYSQSGTYTHAYTSPEGCASVDTLHLTVLHGTHNVETETACESYTWHGQDYTGSGTYTYAYTNAEGCASVDTLYLTVNHGTHNVETETACESYTWHGQAYTGSGTYTYAYTNAEGCASVDTLHLTVNHGTHNVETETACESYTWHGQTYVTSGTYTYAYTNVDGCASEDTLHLSLVMAPGMSAISGAQLVCRNQYETYHYSVDNPNYQYRWYKNNMLVAENESNLTLHEQYAGMVYLTMQVTDDQQICQADTTLAVQVSDNVASDLAEIRRKSSSNILVCEEVSSPYGLVHYRWGYTDRGTGAEATLGGDINYCLYDFGIDTFAYDYWVETWIDYGDASCANRSHFGSSYLSGTEDFDGDVLEAYISHGRVYLFVNTSEPGTVTASLYNANGKLLITRNYGYTDMVTDAFAADFANGVYVLHVTVDGRHHSFKLIKL